MTKRVVVADEYYPFYQLETVGDQNPYGREMPEEFIERYERVMQEFAELQSELGQR